MSEHTVYNLDEELEAGRIIDRSNTVKGLIILAISLGMCLIGVYLRFNG